MSILYRQASLETTLGDCISMFFLVHLYETENHQVTIVFEELEEFDHAAMCPTGVTDEFNEFFTCVMDKLG